MSAWREPRSVQTADLVDELVQAHLDSIEVLLELEVHLHDPGHVDYLRSLVRAAKAQSAVLDPPAGRDRQRR